jgi:hypothetical protein
MTGLAAGLPDIVRAGHNQYGEEDLSVRSVISVLGLYNWEKCSWKGDGFLQSSQEVEASPIRHATCASGKFLLLAGDRDKLFNKHQALQFSDSLRSYKKDVVLCIKKRQNHESLCNINGRLALWALPLIDKFLQE